MNGTAAAMNGDDAVEAVREAERTFYHTQWRIGEELAPPLSWGRCAAGPQARFLMPPG